MARTITRRLELDAGHRLLNHEGKCRNYHGHRYVFDVTVSAKELDGVGRVVDFAAVKAQLGSWLDARLDHGMILQRGDPLAEAFEAQGCKVYEISVPPTAENLAELVFSVARAVLPEELEVVKVVCHETPNCSAEYP